MLIEEQKDLRSLKNGVVVAREDNLGNVLFGETDLVLIYRYAQHKFITWFKIIAYILINLFYKYFRFSPRKQLQR